MLLLLSKMEEDRDKHTKELGYEGGVNVICSQQIRYSAVATMFSESKPLVKWSSTFSGIGTPLLYL